MGGSESEAAGASGNARFGARLQPSANAQAARDACRFRRNLNHAAIAAAPELADKFDGIDINPGRFA
jgi:hypothetical protein